MRASACSTRTESNSFAREQKTPGPPGPQRARVRGSPVNEGDTTGAWRCCRCVRCPLKQARNKYEQLTETFDTETLALLGDWVVARTKL